MGMKFYYSDEFFEVRKVHFVTSGDKVRVHIWTLNGLYHWGHNEREPDMDFRLDEFIQGTGMNSEAAAQVVLTACAMFRSPKAGIGQLKAAVRAYEEE
jgi:hypothetical protein